MTRKPAHSLAQTYERSRAPLYVQIAAALRQRIEDGRWSPGDKISTLEELEAEFQVARVTVRQAVDILEKEGLVQRQQGRGTFVTGIPPDRRWLRLSTDWETLIDSIKDNVPHVIPNEGPPPEPRIDPGDGTADDTVIEEIQVGYTMHGKVIRPAMVKIAKHQSEQPSAISHQLPETDKRKTEEGSESSASATDS